MVNNFRYLKKKLNIQLTKTRERKINNYVKPEKSKQED